MKNLTFTKKDFELVKQDELYKGMFRLARYHVRQRLFKGGMSDVYTREVFERSTASAVLPYDPILDRIILIEQFRAGCVRDEKSPWLLEIPAGIIPKQTSPEETAHQEAMEEAGCTIMELMPILDFYCSPGASDEYLFLFCGKVDAAHIQGVYGLEHEHEDILVHNVSYQEAIQQLNAGEIRTIPTIIALQWLQLNRERVRNLWK